MSACEFERANRLPCDHVLSNTDRRGDRLQRGPQPGWVKNHHHTASRDARGEGHDAVTG